MLESLLDTFDLPCDDCAEDIRYVSYKFLKLICEGIEVEYSIMTCENSYNTKWDVLKGYLEKNNYFRDNQITSEGRDFMTSHPLHFFEKYELNAFDYNDFESYFYENIGIGGAEIVLNYLNQSVSPDGLQFKKEIRNGN